MMPLNLTAKEYGKALRVIRNYYGLSQLDVATAIGVSIPTISHCEAGERPLQFHRLITLCQFWQIRPSTFFTLMESLAHPPNDNDVFNQTRLLQAYYKSYQGEHHGQNAQ